MGRKPKPIHDGQLAALLHAVGANVFDLRTARGKTQSWLAEAAGISLTTLNEIEGRRFRDIRLSTLTNLARALDISIFQLLAGSDFELPMEDRTRLMKASEDILRVIKKIR